MASTQSQSDLLFKPLDFGNFKVQHRVVMAPLTRFRASKQHVPSLLQVTYYGQRAAAPGTLLISEATYIAAHAAGYHHAPGIWNDEQIQAWRKITDEVHKRGSFVYAQLWATGRAADAGVAAEEGFEVVGPSAIPFEGGATPRALSFKEIQEYKELYGQAAENAIAAGFDGVEVHGANGYLLDQFLQDVSNERSDMYGGSIENRARFPLEVIQTIVDRIGAERTAIRLSPFSTYQGMKMTNPIPQFQYFIEQLASRHPNLSYIHLVEPRAEGTDNPDESLDFARSIWNKTGRPFLSAGGFEREQAIEHVSQPGNENELVVFGRHFIANPDLVERLRRNIPLNPYDRHSFYTWEDPKGYVDYPTAQQAGLVVAN